jgi:hypothetical protein
MLLLLPFVRPIDEGGEKLNEHVVTTKAKRCRLHRHTRGCAPKLVGEESATRGDGSLHRPNESIGTAAVERGKPGRFHEYPLPIGEIRIEHGQRGPIGHHAHGEDRDLSANQQGQSCGASRCVGISGWPYRAADKPV